LLIGLDFDNTIVCYDKAIARLADKMFDLPPHLPRTKLALRNFLREAKLELEWTAFQGALYGPGMAFAEPFEQALETMQELKDVGHSLCIVSHRSTRPYAGPAYDLHAAAREWVEEKLASKDLISNAKAFFHETRGEKIADIGALRCNVFMDDLPEVLRDVGFPSACGAILFDPESLHTKSVHRRIACWDELKAILPNFT
jgi:hypothetical protein